MDKYLNRREAGKILAESLRAYANRKDVIVLALPRGGVPVAFEVANALNTPLDLFVVRKLGVPGHSELAMGAIASGGAQVFNQEILNSARVTQDEIDQVLLKEQKELARREQAYRGSHEYPSLKNKTIILVDDGIATGATMRVAIKALKQYQPAEIIVAVPVAQRDLCEDMLQYADAIISPLQPLDLYSVGAWYDDFSQTEDEEVYSLLRQASNV